jgi:acyl-CoA synthetase (NDP forming)
MCATIFRMGRRAGVTFSQVVNTGNEAAVEFADYLDFLAEDPATTSAVCYIEELRNGPAFLKAASKFRAAGKLLAVYRAGASDKGAEATRSHTAALAGDTAAYDAAFARAGVTRAGDFSGLSDLACLHGLGSKIGGSNCAILSVSGAAGAILSDALSLNGGGVPTLPAEVQAGLRAQIPAFGMVANPVDLTGNLVNANDFVFEAIGLALSPDDIDVLLLYLPGNFLTQALAQIERAAASTSKAIIVIDTFALADRERLAAAGIGYFDDFDRAARAVCAYGKWKSAPSTQHRHAERVSASIAPPDTEACGEEWPQFPPDRTALSETEGKEALAAFGVPVVHDALVQTVIEARKAAEKIGYPLVAKHDSPDGAH